MTLTETINEKIDGRACNIVAYYSAQSYVYTNFKSNGKRKSKKHIPYIIPDKGMEILNARRSGDIDKVKGLILRFTLLHREINLDKYTNWYRYWLNKRILKPV